MRAEAIPAAEFFLPMNPPTVTDQMHRIVARPGHRPMIFDSDELRLAKDTLKAHLAKQRAELFAQGYQTIRDTPIRLKVMWCFPKGAHRDGEYRITKPDTDNLQKALKDTMTKLDYWQDDSLVCVEQVEKFWASIPGIYVRIDTIRYQEDDAQ